MNTATQIPIILKEQASAAAEQATPTLQSVSTNLAYLIPWALIPFGLFVFSNFFVQRNIDWYKGLHKSKYTAPRFVQQPVWALLYGFMSYSGYSVWSNGGFKDKTGLPMVLYLLQLALTSAWPPLFYGKHQLKLSLYESGALWSTLLLSAYYYRPYSTIASNLVLVYLGWLTYEIYCNYQLVKLNKSKDEGTKAAESKKKVT